ncbi:antibiotic biosynthesis monooxygenase family protein [Acidiphilium iwatense]|uniref:Antibiotic biosynthesis monooxygenase n=1 Tax=Acidiphilium iwatense TaxID=768198 RepID=A0ABS9DYV3_9PROT|nr:antibiotic biosynthesis monooxygenase [Acidiphilium iwatense]MCF3946975.1 antibiotic biosynthesis monooxygenase [Acidiphilium iwatense]
MFAVIFEVHPKPEQWDAYIGHAGMLRPELVRVNGFVDNVRYRSKRREGWLLSLSVWRDEKALVRWRTHALHHAVQKKGRFEIFQDYHLRVGQITVDTDDPEGSTLPEQRLDATETGAAKVISIIETKQQVEPPEGVDGLVTWDAFEAILTPGDFLLLLSWRDADAAARFEPPDGALSRHVRVIRDYGMYDRYEAPQYYEDVTRPAEIE